MEQKALKEKYMDIIVHEVWPNSPDMQAYARRKVGYIVELDNGDIYEIEKPRIEKDFCFGYGYCGISTQEEYEAAASMSDKAETDQNYFLRENLRGIDEWIADLESPDVYAYKFVHYTGQPEGSKLKGIRLVGYLSQTPEYSPHMYHNLKDLAELTQEERKALADGYREVRKAFEKRLNTYLKKYGLSKVRSWTYLSD